MSTPYAIYVSDPGGTRLGDASTFVSLKYSRVVNGVSTAYLSLPDSFDTSLLRIPDGRIEIWRRAQSGGEYLDTETIWLIKAVQYQRDSKGRKTILAEADTPLSIFGDPGRVVFAYSNAYTTDASGNAAADDQIRTLAINAVGDTTNNALIGRRMAQIAFARAQTQGAVISKVYPWRNVLKTMQELADASTASGMYVAFDLVSPTPDTLEFRTYAQQRGVDHRFPAGANPVILSPDLGNLAETTLRLDYRGVASRVYCGGRGEGTSKTIGDAQDTTLRDISPFGNREAFIEYTNSADSTVLRGEALAALRAKRPRLTFRGRLVETDDTQYGVHWGWGDYVTAQDFGQSFDCRIEAVTVTVQPEQQQSETIEAYIRGEVTTTTTSTI